jgi:hypothetical protein
VGLDGSLADAQSAADLLVGEPLGHQPQYLRLTWTERVCRPGPRRGEKQVGDRGSSGACPAAAARTAASRSAGSASFSW